MISTSLIRVYIKILVENIPGNSRVISSTGYNSRELLYLRKNTLKNKDFIW